MTAGKWKFSYYGPVMRWDGKVFTFDPTSARARLESLKVAGMDWLGVDGINLLEPTAHDFEDVVRRTGAWMDELGLRMSSFHFAGPTFAPVGENQSAVIANFHRNLAVFAPWRPNAYVIHAGWILREENSVEGVTGGIQGEITRHGLDAVVETLAGNLKQFARAASPHGIRLALETMGSLLLPFGGEEDLPRLIQAIDEPNVGYCLDSGHVHLCGQSVVDWVLRCGSRLFETHFHDNRGRGKDEHMPVGFGTIDWPGVIQALDRIGFEGPVTFETGGWPGLDPVAGYRQAMAWWRSCEHLADELSRKADGAHS